MSFEHVRLSRRQALLACGGSFLGITLLGCGRFPKSKGKGQAGAAPTATPAPSAANATTAAPPASDGPQSLYTMSVDGDWRHITANGIPNHAHGEFPNAHCPEHVSEQNYVFQLAANPQKAAEPVDLAPVGGQTYIFGIAVSGVPFDPSGPWYPSSGEYDWHFDATSPIGHEYLGLDTQNAHSQMGGRYHYHGVPSGLIAVLRAKTPAGMLFLGYAADGFPIYGAAEARSSFRLKQGTRPSAPGGAYDGTFEQDYEFVAGLGDLDECNGRDGVTPEYPNGTYYYVITDTYPFVPRQLRGTPHASFLYGPKGKAASATSPGTPGGAMAPLPPDMRKYKPKDV